MTTKTNNDVAMRKHPRPTPERLREVFDYNPETGVVLRRVASGKRYGGKEAGGLDFEGYRQAKLGNLKMRLHIVAFVLMTGEYPTREIDHINGVRDDNRWCNLREATKSENQRNSKTTSRNTSGVKGVRFVKKTGRWEAYIKIHRKLILLGQYSTLEEAAQVRREAAEKTHGKFVRHG